jgi:ribosome recycling factor
MPYDFSGFKNSADSAYEWLKKEYAGIRTNRATPSILDGVTVLSYGSSMPINQLATVSIEGPKSLRITPWDKEVAKDIDKAIRESNLGVSVSLDSAGLRVAFPDLTSDRRVMLSKLAKEKLEESRITIRTEREKILSDLDRKEKDGDISEDENFRFRNELQKLVDAANEKMSELTSKKEKEIME